MRKYQKETTVNNTDFIKEIEDNAESPLLAAFAIRLVQCIDESGLTQSEVAEKTGLSPSNLSDYIHGKQEPKIGRVDKLARFFNVSADYLLGRAKCKKPTNEEISKATGLSEKAINRLKRMNESEDGFSYRGEISLDLDGLPVINALLEEDSDILTLLNHYLFSAYEIGFNVTGVRAEGLPGVKEPITDVVKLILEVPVKGADNEYLPEEREVDSDFLRYMYLKQIEEKLSVMMNRFKKAAEDKYYGVNSNE